MTRKNSLNWRSFVQCALKDFAVLNTALPASFVPGGPRDSSEPLRPRKTGNAGGFTLVEVSVAMAIGLAGLTVFCTAASQAIQIVRSAKQMANASQLLQMRLETIRLSSPWVNVTTGAGLQSLIAMAAPSAANFPGVTETYTIVPYPADGTSLTVSRSPAGVMSFSGADLSTQSCVQITASLQWKGATRRPRQRQLSTIVTKGGL